MMTTQIMDWQCVGTIGVGSGLFDWWSLVIFRAHVSGFVYILWTWLQLARLTSSPFVHESCTATARVDMIPLV